MSRKEAPARSRSPGLLCVGGPWVLLAGEETGGLDPGSPPHLGWSWGLFVLQAFSLLSSDTPHFPLVAMVQPLRTSTTQN